LNNNSSYYRSMIFEGFIIFLLFGVINDETSAFSASRAGAGGGVQAVCVPAGGAAWAERVCAERYGGGLD
jgi:hypothetical protein